MGNWKLPHVNSSLNVWGIVLWRHRIFTEVRDRTLRSIKCSRSAVFSKKTHFWRKKRKRSLLRILSMFFNVFCVSYKKKSVGKQLTPTQHLPDIGCGTLPNKILTLIKLIFKNCRIKACFNALVYDLLSFKTNSPFFNVCTVWLYTLS